MGRDNEAERLNTIVVVLESTTSRLLGRSYYYALPCYAPWGPPGSFGLHLMI